MRAIATVSLSGELPDKLEAIARAGYTGVEIFENDLLSYGGSPEEVRALAESLGLKIIALQPFRDFEAMPSPQRERNFERAERKFKLMKALGTDFMLVCSNTSPLCIDDKERAAADLYELAERAAAHGLRIGFEALAWGRYTSDYRDAWDIVQRGNHPNLGLVLDSFHMLALGLDPAPVADIPGERIFLVQVADAPLLDMDVLSWSRHHRCFPGQGRLPIKDFMKALAKTGYCGPLSHEIFNDAFRAAPTQATALDGIRSLILLENMATNSQMFTPLPSAPAYDGIHFIEFTLDEESAKPLGKLISALGFKRIGRHRSKNIDLWRQGDIHFVLNFETDSFAHTFRLLHGISVCAVGFRVNDPDLALARARAFKAQFYSGPVGEGEMRIPALRGPEGSLIYLVDPETAKHKQWHTDFELFGESEGQQAGLRCVDHISYVLQPTQMQSWQLFYKTVFDFAAGSEHELADPRGLVMSQAVISHDQSIRLPLNVSPARETLPGRFLSEHQGGVQQIALATDNIFDTIDKIVANGVELLPIPDNYYDDLAARIDLDEPLLEAIRQRHILYDRTDEGEFFHAYTPLFAGHFYFEIVERRLHYSQFGAANAAIRLAAQARMSKQRGLA
ncbi:bifunctional sugar phosphate isomerase/epimerase/4-hydroxyphenylpyruvate dioxygenase family protein [Phytohalomonas tamaricis]|uniref:bifunctional sugar phosphate isomerase/epimerase/4-hydroxyphenylpyruvate dioxygenase family protein n=1 Tax=Phytohalomonas tamaricis TaxID=2081032 RepID=UPI000D0B6BDA|nr:sugar phosphate isomerase/epimerase and 4-hydroxyphenylpyruvate domain-containing protein [Phytohalomonas tamaricis]